MQLLEFFFETTVQDVDMSLILCFVVMRNRAKFLTSGDLVTPDCQMGVKFCRLRMIV